MLTGQASLELVVNVWIDLDAQLAVRLEALFVSHDVDGILFFNSFLCG
jgi:hypothetical protein